MHFLRRFGRIVFAQLLAFIALSCMASALSVSEILFDPDGNDNGLEFVELSGTENLSGCTIADDRSSDVLTFVRARTDPGPPGPILIVEEDGVYNETPRATIYHAGRAIGNGLGNSKDRIAISCGDTQLLTIEYDIATIDGFEEGNSILWQPGQQLWHAGAPSPGSIDDANDDAVLAAPLAPSRDERHETPPCNTTLLVTVSDTNVTAGEGVTMTIVADGYAAFLVESGDGELLLSGDTLTRNEYGFVAPDTDRVKITATAEQCDARQRAVRIVEIGPVPAPRIVELDEAAHATALRGNDTATWDGAGISTGIALANASAPVLALEAPQADVPPDHAAHDDAIVPGHLATARVIADSDANVIPWVSAFGIVTLALGAWLFKTTKTLG